MLVLDIAKYGSGSRHAKSWPNMVLLNTLCGVGWKPGIGIGTRHWHWGNSTKILALVHCLALANFCWDGLEVPRGVVKGLWAGNSLEERPFGQFSNKSKRGQKGSKLLFLVQLEWNFVVALFGMIPNFCWGKGPMGRGESWKKAFWAISKKAKRVKRAKIVISYPIGMGLFLKCRSRKMIIRISYQIWASPYPFQDKRVRSWDPSWL